MKNYLFIIACLTFTTLVVAQDKNNSDYNKWSVEVNVGQNKPEKPYAAGYFSSDPTKYFNFNGIEHIDLGVRYMFNTTFGAKLDFGYDIMQNQTGTASLPFETNQYRVGLQGVINVGRMLQFESFTKRFGLLVHGGLQVSQLTPQMGVNKDVTEDNGGLILGVTPQVRISNRIVLTGDFSYLGNVRQHFAWDGSYSEASNNLTGSLFNTSLGLTFYLGKNDKHADWTFVEDTQAKAFIQLPLDSDGDGIADVNDNCPNEKGTYALQGCPDSDKDGVADKDDNCPTVFGYADNKGCPWLDTDGDSVLDKDDKCPTVKGSIKNNGCPEEVATTQAVSSDVVAQINKYSNLILFDTNKFSFKSSSYKILDEIKAILLKYPTTKFSIEGHTDSDGDFASNQKLSEERAKQVKQWLINNGIEFTRLSSIGYGESKPRDTNNTYTGKLNNRRVEIKLIN